MSDESPARLGRKTLMAYEDGESVNIRQDGGVYYIELSDGNEVTLVAH